MSKTFRRAAMSSICMLIVAVMSLTGATYAWFTVGDTATVDGMKMEIVAASGGIEVYNEATGKWANSFSLALNMSSVNPVSTTDATNFVILDSYDAADSEKIKVAVDPLSNNVSSNVIVKELKLRNTGAADMTIDLRNTFVQDVAQGEGTNAKTTSIGKAARIAVFEKTGATWALRGVMAPYYSETTGEGNVVTKAFEIDTTTYRGINYSAASYNGYFYFRNGTDAKGVEYSADPTHTAEVEMVTPANNTVKLPGLADNEPVEVTIKVVAWLEGQDADCSNPNAGGAFNINLQFNRVTADVVTKDGQTVEGIEKDPAVQ